MIKKGKMGIFNRKNKETKFWEWFEENSEEIFNFEKNQDEVFKKINGRLRKISKGLGFMFGPKIGKKREFIITASGVKHIFPVVEKIVAAAPKLKKWKITAFVPPSKKLENMGLEGLTLWPKDMYFFHELGESNKINLKLYIKDFVEGDQRYIQLSFIILDNIIGEYAVVTKVGFVDFYLLPAKKKRDELHPLKDLRGIIDKIK